MKKLIFSSLVFMGLLFSCQSEIKVSEQVNAIKELNLKLKTNKLQVFEFVLKNDTIIVGNEGTGIEIPKDLFENYSNGKISLEFKEFYKKEDIILNQLSTISNKNELLETSGMFYVNFKENGKQLKLKKGKFYKILVPKKILKNSNIYYNTNDSVFNWKLTDVKINTSIPDKLRNLQFGITPGKNGIGGYFKEVAIDSLLEVTRMDSVKIANYVENNKSEDLVSEIIFSNDKLGWINIDKVLDFEIQKDITFKNKDSEGPYSVNFIYLDNNTFINELVYSEDELIPLKIRGKVKVVVYSMVQNKILFDSFFIDKNSKTECQINLKETTLEKLKNEMIVP